MAKYVTTIFIVAFISLVAACAIVGVILLCILDCPSWEIVFAGIFAFIVTCLWFVLIAFGLGADV